MTITYNYTLKGTTGDQLQLALAAPDTPSTHTRTVPAVPRLEHQLINTLLGAAQRSASVVAFKAVATIGRRIPIRRGQFRRARSGPHGASK